MKYKIAVVGAAVLLMFSVGAPLVAQDADSQPPAQTQTFPPDQLAAMVAPIALYPDALLSQVLVASTYPLEIVEAAQWLRQNSNLQGQQLVDAARQQNWDPSVQALVVFPDVINRLNSNVRWTTDLGNAFLAQQADVMAAVQRLRAEAQASGKLNSNSQETVTSQTQGDQSAIAIQPADPQVVYVPAYNPEYVWGPPPFGYYPPLYYPAGFGFGWGSGIYIGGFFGGLGWGGWGWGPNWFGGNVFVNGFFFNHYGFGGGRFAGGGVWAHNPEHRMGVAYSNQRVASRFGGNFAGGNRSANRESFAGSRFQGSAAPAARSSQGNAFRSAEPRSSAPRSSAPRSSEPRFNAPAQNFRGSPAYNGGSAYRSAAPNYRSAAPSYRSAAPSYRSAQPTYRSAAPTYRSAAPTYRSAPSGGSSGFHSAPRSAAPSSGGGFHGGGGGGSHSGGGHR